MTTRLASTVAELLAAARAAAPGDVIQLAAGDYPGVSLRDVVKAEPGVVVEPQAGAAVTLALGLSACAGFTFRGLTLVVDPRTKLCANVFNSDRVAFEDVEGHGDLGLIDNGITVINLRASRQVAVRRARIHHALCGVQHIDCVGLEVSDSTFTLLSLDGVRGASDECDVLRNVFHDFHAQPGYHADPIQFWTTNRKAGLKGVRVRDNVITRGAVEASATQGILLGNEANGKVDPVTGLALSTPYERVEITGNAILGGTELGISVSGAIDALIADNYLNGYAGTVNAAGKLAVPRILVRESTSGRVLRNRASLIDKSLSSGVTYDANEILALAAPGDESGLRAWLALRAGVDPRDAKIADLEARLAAEIANENDLAAQLAAGTSEAAALRADLKAAAAVLAIVRGDRDEDRAALQTIRDASAAALATFPEAA